MGEELTEAQKDSVRLVPVWRKAEAIEDPRHVVRDRDIKIASNEFRDGHVHEGHHRVGHGEGLVDAALRARPSAVRLVPCPISLLDGPVTSAHSAKYLWYIV